MAGRRRTCHDCAITRLCERVIGMRAAIVAVLVIVGITLAECSAWAIMVAPSETVGPPRRLVTSCTANETSVGGDDPGPPIPIHALALGTPVDRNENSFPTGGSGTANATLAYKRKMAGLQYEPRTFDPSGNETPSVFAEAPSEARDRWVYQRLLMKPSRNDDPSYGMIYALATSPTRGQIASVAMTLPNQPSTAPRLVLEFNGNFCVTTSLAIYAPQMSAEQLRKLFSANSRCNWFNLSGCAPDDRPRGKIVFVKTEGNRPGYEHRWVDYDLMLPQQGK